MFRKIAIALGASAAIAATALAPTAASAKGGKHWHHWHGFHNGLYVGLYPGYIAPDCYTVRKVVWTKYGKRVRYYEVCD